MPRVTVQVSAETDEWLDDEKRRTGKSKAKLGGECIELIHSDVDHIEEARSDVMQSESNSRLEELEDRVDDLEARIEASPMAHERDARTGVGQAADGATSDDPSPVESQYPSERAVSGSEQSGSGPPTAERVRQQLEDLDVKGRRAETRKARRDCALWAWEFLRDEGTATSSDIANHAFGAFWDKPLGYTTSSRYPGYGLWDNFLRETLKELPCVDPAPERGNEWRFQS